jgi:hypothetical protein
MNRGLLLVETVLVSTLISSTLFFSLTVPVKKVCAVETFYIGVYWDSDCTSKILSIDWGVLKPGSAREMRIFLRNEELDVPCYLYMRTENWEPIEGSPYISLSCTHNFGRIEIDETISTTLTLEVARNIRGIEDFYFDIIFCGADHMFGDLNQDEIVDIYDAILFSYAYLSTHVDSNWNPQADLNNDDIVNIFDLTILSQCYIASRRAS